MSALNILPDGKKGIHGIVETFTSSVIMEFSDSKENNNKNRQVCFCFFYSGRTGEHFQQ